MFICGVLLLLAALLLAFEPRGKVENVFTVCFWYYTFADGYRGGGIWPALTPARGVVGRSQAPGGARLVPAKAGKLG